MAYGAGSRNGCNQIAPPAGADIRKGQGMEVKLPAKLNDLGASLTRRLVVGLLRGVAGRFFSRPAGGAITPMVTGPNSQDS